MDPAEPGPGHPGRRSAHLRVKPQPRPGTRVPARFRTRPRIRARVSRSPSEDAASPSEDMTRGAAARGRQKLSSAQGTARGGFTRVRRASQKQPIARSRPAATADAHGCGRQIPVAASGAETEGPRLTSGCWPSSRSSRLARRPLPAPEREPASGRHLGVLGSQPADLHPQGEHPGPRPDTRGITPGQAGTARCSTPITPHPADRAHRRGPSVGRRHHDPA
jgi:hypothetical protein